MPPLGDKINELGSATIGIIVFSHVVNSKLFSSITKPTRACIIPKRRPIQLRGPGLNESKDMKSIRRMKKNIATN